MAVEITIASYTPEFNLNNWLDTDGSQLRPEEGNASISSQSIYSMSFTAGEDLFFTDYKFRSNYTTGNASAREEFSPRIALYNADGSGIPTTILATFRSRLINNSLEDATVYVDNTGDPSGWSNIYTRELSGQTTASGLNYVKLTSGQNYALVLYQGSPEYWNKLYGVGDNLATTYTAGNTYYTNTAGASWVPSTADFYMEANGVTTKPDPPTLVAPTDGEANVRSDITIFWEDSGRYTWSYDVYFDISGVQPIGTTKVIDDTYQHAYTPAGLSEGDVCLVRIVPKNTYADGDNFDFSFTIGPDQLIANQTDWENIDSAPSAKYVVTNNFSITGSYDPICKLGNVFNGVIEGAGYTIDFAGASITEDPTFIDVQYGAIRNTSAASIIVNLTIKNYTSPNQTPSSPPIVVNPGSGVFVGEHDGLLVNCHSVDATIEEAGFCGGMYGYSLNTTSVCVGCSVSGLSLTTSKGSGGKGGFGGWVSGPCSQCYAQGEITNNNTQTNANTGGFAGTLWYTLTDCYAKVNIGPALGFVGERVGGMCGEQQSDPAALLRCYCTGTVPLDEDEDRNPFIGRQAIDAGPVIDCYYVQGLLTEVDPSDVIPLNSTEIERSSSFEGSWPDHSFSNSDTWKITNNLTTPLFEDMPSKPILLSPSNGATGVNNTPCVLYWTGSTPYPASSYDVYIGATMGSMTFRGNTTDTQFDCTEFVSGTNDWYWYVNAIGGFDNTASDTWSFSLAAFSPPIPGGDGLSGALGFSVNAMKTYRRLVVIVDDEVWYEDI